ncbi:YbaN family protein [Sphingomonas sp. ac-8]|uniref:YbaN family protein n=1 Tax=Sphingomonas sp. ac-8 TaxID=3242977 RepID=UPI003A8131F0
MPGSADADPERSELLRRGRPARLAWLSLGLLLVAIGFVGIFVPLLPTVDFLILALACFARSSPRLELWLLRHPRFGPALTAWQRHGAIPRHAKWAACLSMTVGYALFCWGARPPLWLALTIAAVLAACALWILRRPTGAPVR